MILFFNAEFKIFRDLYLMVLVSSVTKKSQKSLNLETDIQTPDFLTVRVLPFFLLTFFCQFNGEHDIALEITRISNFANV